MWPCGQCYLSRRHFDVHAKCLNSVDRDWMQWWLNPSIGLMTASCPFRCNLLQHESSMDSVWDVHALWQYGRDHDNDNTINAFALLFWISQCRFSGTLLLLPLAIPKKRKKSRMKLLDDWQVLCSEQQRCLRDHNTQNGANFISGQPQLFWYCCRWFPCVWKTNLKAPISPCVPSFVFMQPGCLILTIWSSRANSHCRGEMERVLFSSFGLWINTARSSAEWKHSIQIPSKSRAAL